MIKWLFPYSRLLWVPNNTNYNRTVLYIAWIAVSIYMWQFYKPTVFPSPIEIIAALPGLVQDGLLSELYASFSVNAEALCLSAVIGLPIAYFCRVPVMSPIACFVGKLRFVGSAVFFLPLLFLLSGGHAVKVWLLTLGELFYLVTTMAGVVQNIPEYRFDDARTLAISEWRSVWYVVIRGTVAEALDAIRDNAAMGWSMLMFVEGVVRSEGGVGVMILNQEKHVEFASVYAITLCILAVGIIQDYTMGLVRKVACPYAK